MNGKRKLSTVPWVVWFLGYGFGGCVGIGSLVGLWSLCVDGISFSLLPVFAFTLLHAATQIALWARRHAIYADFARRLSLLASSMGTACTAFILISAGSNVSGLQSLYGLAAMHLCMALFLPPLPPLRAGQAANKTSEMQSSAS